MSNNIEYKSVMFTDMKDFSLKTSLLTNYQIDNLLNEQDNIILSSIDKYKGEVVKTIGDSFMVIFSEPAFSILCAIDIQNSSKKYNLNKKIDLFKLEFRISISYGKVTRKIGVKGIDYFGETVNLSSRIQNRTPENYIFISGDLYDKIKECNYLNTIFLGKTTFKGILNKIDIYEVLYKKNEIRLNTIGGLNKNKLTNIILDKRLVIREKKIEDIIFKVSSAVAVMSLQPIPFLDSTTVIPLQAYLINEISKIYKINEKKDIIFSALFGILSTYTLSHGLLGLSKIGLPFLGGYIIMPINFSLTYGLGKVINQFFYYKSYNIDLSSEDTKNLFKDSRIKGKKLAKDNKNKIFETGNKYKDIFMKKI